MLRSAQSAQRAALAPGRCGPSAAMARVAVWLSGFWAAPLLAAPTAGRLRGGMRVGARMLRYLTRRVCPNAAAQQRSELCGAPRKRPAAGLPRRGRRLQGRLSFGYFSLAKQRTSTSPAGARPGPRPQHRHRHRHNSNSNSNSNNLPQTHPDITARQISPACDTPNNTKPINPPTTVPLILMY